MEHNHEEHTENEVKDKAKIVPIHTADDGHDHGPVVKDQPGWKTHWDLLLALSILIVLLV